MLIGFVGSPCSGKTTTAAALFSELKNMGYPVEFIPEQARRYIMLKRARENTDMLTEVDQDFIYKAQKKEEEMYRKLSTRTIAISDGSTVNSCFYTNGPLRGDLVEELERYDIVFFCRGLHKEVEDENRVHDLEFSKKIDGEMAHDMLELSAGYLPTGIPNLKTLWGTRDNRLCDAVEFFKEKYENN